MFVRDRQKVVFLYSLYHAEMNEGKHVVTSPLHDTLKKEKTKVKRCERAKNTYNVTGSEKFGEAGEVDEQLIEDLLRNFGAWKSFFKFGGQVEYLVHDDEEVVGAPLLVVGDHIGHDSVDLLDDIHLEQLFKFDLPRGYNCADYLHRECVELLMSDSKVLEQH